MGDKEERVGSVLPVLATFLMSKSTVQAKSEAASPLSEAAPKLSTAKGELVTENHSQPGRTDKVFRCDS